jgi:hypothetical protein
MINFKCTSCGASNGDVKISDGAKTVLCQFCGAVNMVQSPAVEQQVVTEHKSNCWAVDDHHVVIGSPYCQGCGMRVNPGTTKHVKGGPPQAEQNVVPRNVNPLSGCFRFVGGSFGLLFWLISSVLLGFVLFVMYGYFNQHYNVWIEMVFRSWIYKDWNLLLPPWIYFEWIAQLFLRAAVAIVSIIPGLLFVIGCGIELLNVLLGWALWPGLMSGTITINDLIKATSNP